MNIGDRFNKDITNEQYSNIILWCRDNEAFLADEGDYYEIEELEVNPDLTLISEMNDLQVYLNNTDYCIVKCIEKGLDIETEYPGVKTQRDTARIRIREIREILENN